ncbi:MAG: T9SS type A sorting domain-containing protein [Flavobacteriales bacterium]|nr:T9SS type A sorting domain-containing protein [Flavobacteriales bacterium]
MRVCALIGGLLYSSSLSLSAQCGACTPNTGCYQPQGAQCPPSGQSPVMTVGEYYSEDVTFYMPPDTNISGIGNIQIVNVWFQNISGLPNGITWQCNNSANNCNYAPSSGEKWACIRFCGTPVCVPGSYTAVITIIGTAATPFGNQNQTSQLEYVFHVQPPAGGNSGFTYTPSQGCDSLTAQFNALINVGAPFSTEWLWDFGNGQTSTLQNPAPVHYSAPGTYIVTLGTKIFKYVLTQVSCTSNGNWWCGDIEEPQLFGACTQSPEFYFQLTHGPGFYQSPEAPSGTSASWGPLSVVLQSFNLALSFWDADTGPPFGSQDDDGGTYAIQISGAGTYNFTTSSPFGGGMTGSFTIAKVLDTLIVTTDTLVIYPSPLTPQISAQPNDTVCEGQTVTLATTPGNWIYTWFRNGQIIPGQDQNSLSASDSGQYRVRITHPGTGCTSLSPDVTIGHWPGLYNATIANNNGILSVVSPPAASYQWLYNGQPVFPNGTGPTYEPKYTGPYSCVFFNAYGCSDTSQVIVVSSLVSLEDIQEKLSMQVYPNPVTDILSVTWTDDTHANRLEIFDAAGRTVLAMPISGSAWVQVPVSTMEPGFYILKLSGARFLQHRFIKH